ncbi:MAG: alanine dehydrogenase [Planctomycetota bacterium]
MKVGVVKEIKNHEYRVALRPSGAEQLVKDGHKVVVEAGAGAGTSFTDDQYREAGAEVLPTAADVWGAADMVMKVKEPLASEWPHMRAGQTVFTYFHLAADRALTDGVLATGAHCFAYETLVDPSVKGLPLLEPMSEVAGRLSIQEGAKFLEKPMGGRGVLLGGVPGVETAEVVVIGGGIVGTQAAKMAAGLGARVTVLDRDIDRMRYLDDVLPANCTTVYSNPTSIRESIERADLVVGAVLIAGAAAPKLVSRADLKLMKPGAVVVDVAVDQGGCFETTRPTTHEEPVFDVDGIVHYCVANMPGAVPRTSTFALTNATLGYARRLARLGPKASIETDHALRTAANAVGGKLTCEAVAQAFGMEYVAPGVAAEAI